MCNNLSLFSELSDFPRESESFILVSHPALQHLTYESRDTDDNRGSGR